MNKNLLFFFSSRFAFIVFLFISLTYSFVLDHTYISRFDSLTQAQTEKVKKLSILFAHQSVGTYILQGMVTINQNYPDGKFNFPIFPDPSIYPITAPQCSDWSTKGPGIGHMWAGGDNNVLLFFSYLSQCSSSVKIALIKQGYVNMYTGMTAQKRFDDYKTKVNEFRSSHPGVIILHSTMQLMKSASGANDATNVERNKYRELILREYQNEYVLDVADLVSWQNGAYSTYSYNGNNYLKMDDSYAIATEPPGDSHPNQAGRVMLAKGLWVFLSQVAEDLNKGINSPPLVNAGANNIIIMPDTQYTLQGSIEDDGLPNPPGRITSIWSLINTNSDVTIFDPININTLVNFPSQEANYLFRLTATDGELAAYDTVQISVVKSILNSPPIAIAGNDRTIFLPETSLTLSGTVTDDGLPANPTRLITKWNLLSGPGLAMLENDSTPITEVIIKIAGQYHFQLYVSDGEFIVCDTVSITLTNFDNQAPTPPKIIGISIIEPDRILLNWFSSTDNVKVGGYDIYRSGHRIASITDTFYTDSGLSSIEQHCFTIRSVDVNLNYSNFSDSICTKIGIFPTSTTAILPNADSFISEMQPNLNFGKHTFLSAGKSDDTRTVFLSFKIPKFADSLFITSARLRLFVNEESYNSGGKIKAIITDPLQWDETTITFTNQLEINRESQVLDSIGQINNGDSISFNVFDEQLFSNEFISFKIFSESSDGVRYYSKEISVDSLKPKLILQTALKLKTYYNPHLPNSKQTGIVPIVNSNLIQFSNLPVQKFITITLIDIRGRILQKTKHFTSSSNLNIPFISLKDDSKKAHSVAVLILAYDEHFQSYKINLSR